MLQFEAIGTPAPRPSFKRTSPAPLPLYLEPAPDEALLSWLLRLATRLQVPLHVLAHQSFGVDDRQGRSRWWSRPNRWLLARISAQTGVSVTRLRRMTFEKLEPPYRDDEAHARFAGSRYDTRAPDWRKFRFAVCGPCVERDATPYLRNSWLVGWMAVCPEHDLILITRCNECRSALRVAPFGTMAAFSPSVCIRCGASLLDGRYTQAHPSVVRMQSAFLEAKRQGGNDFDGLGKFTWRELVSFADIVLGMIWTHTTSAEREHIFLRYQYESLDQPRRETRVYHSRHDSFRFLAWLIEGWPAGEGPQIAIGMIERWLSGERNRLSHHLRAKWADPWSLGTADFDPAICERLRKLA